MRIARIITAAIFILGVSVAARAAPDSPANWPGQPGRYVFAITRDGTPIGRQSIEIRQAGDTVTAVTESAVAVKILGIVVYRMHQTITETYRGRNLVALHAETKDGDGQRVVELARSGDRWTGRLNGEARAFDCDCLASPMWQVASLGKDRIIEASQARVQRVSVADRGTETLNLPKGPVAARHFSVQGGIAREVWYDPEGNLVAAQQVGRDGSVIRQKLIAGPGAL